MPYLISDDDWTYLVDTYLPEREAQALLARSTECAVPGTELQRWEPSRHGYMEQEPQGEWVRYDDIAAMQADFETRMHNSLLVNEQRLDEIADLKYPAPSTELEELVDDLVLKADLRYFQSDDALQGAHAKLLDTIAELEGRRDFWKQSCDHARRMRDAAHEKLQAQYKTTTGDNRPGFASTGAIRAAAAKELISETAPLTGE